MRYPFLLFDADNTLFDFDRADRYAFGMTCQSVGLEYTEELHNRYRVHNDVCWTMFDRGEATKDFIVLERFRRFFAELGIDADPAEANKAQLAALSTCAFPMPHSIEVCRTLAETHRLFLITNAVASVQRGRLARAEIRPYLEAAFISEEAGAQKPTREYFDYVFSHIDGVTRENCLVIGDSLTSDIQGANDYGLACCWFNPRHAPNPNGLRVDYEITDLRELFKIV
ncbi:MAG: noncanonical pyrimidine nucleotidase, YjjG family [Ruminococcaceae bacterium]|nr:noncanonical pyrimidine nucleotidase, YjjG family [Oscillospiraceae bacterium]